MPRRKKLTPSQKAINWLDDHRRIIWLLIMVLIVVFYLLIHSYRGWADTRRLQASRRAIDSVYANINKSIGQPDNLAATNQCSSGSRLGQTYILCSVETDFIYGVADQSQANIIRAQVQKAVANSRGFKATQKLSSQLSTTQVFDHYAYRATDYYRGPYGANCQVKYSFATPDDVTLSLKDSSLEPFEIFFSCSHQSVKAIYPDATKTSF